MRGEASARAGAFGSGMRRRIARGPGTSAAGNNNVMGGGYRKLEGVRTKKGAGSCVGLVFRPQGIIMWWGEATGSSRAYRRKRAPGCGMRSHLSGLIFARNFELF